MFASAKIVEVSFFLQKGTQGILPFWGQDESEKDGTVLIILIDKSDARGRGKLIYH